MIALGRQQCEVFCTVMQLVKGPQDTVLVMKAVIDIIGEVARQSCEECSQQQHWERQRAVCRIAVYA